MVLSDNKLIQALPPLYSQENEKDPIIQVRLFLPMHSWQWYPIEYNRESKICFGYVYGLENELGYFSLDELNSLKDTLGIGVDVDLNFKPTPLSQIKKNCV